MKRLLFACCVALALAAPASALVRLDEGRRQIMGIQLLQDASDPKSYFYVPSYPRLATNADGFGMYLDATAGDREFVAEDGPITLPFIVPVLDQRVTFVTANLP